MGGGQMIGNPYKAPSNGRDATCGGKTQPLGLYAIKQTRLVSYAAVSTANVPGPAMEENAGTQEISRR